MAWRASRDREGNARPKATRRGRHHIISYRYGFAVGALFYGIDPFFHALPRYRKCTHPGRFVGVDLLKFASFVQATFFLRTWCLFSDRTRKPVGCVDQPSSPSSLWVDDAHKARKRR